MLPTHNQTNSKEKAVRAERKDKTRRAYKPLDEKKYFLSVKNYRGNDKLKEEIRYLGGVIEDFFSKEVDYVITDRVPQKPLSPLQEKNFQSPTTPSSGISNVYGSPLDNISPQEDKRVPQTRSQILLARAQLNQPAKIDILENARKLNIPIVSLAKLQRYLSALKENPDYVDPSRKAKKAPSVPSSVKVIKLRAPYLKLEDTERKYCPLYKEFTKYPFLDLETPAPCPFIGRLDIKRVCKERKENQQNKPPIKRPGKVQLCEICNVRFTNLTLHLNSLEHIKYSTSYNNYKALDELIDSFPLPSNDSLETDQ